MCSSHIFSADLWELTLPSRKSYWESHYNPFGWLVKSSHFLPFPGDLWSSWFGLAYHFFCLIFLPITLLPNLSASLDHRWAVTVSCSGQSMRRCFYKGEREKNLNFLCYLWCVFVILSGSKATVNGFRRCPWVRRMKESKQEVESITHRAEVTSSHSSNGVC